VLNSSEQFPVTCPSDYRLFMNGKEPGQPIRNSLELNHSLPAKEIA
jgi:hypothetical protein